LPSLSKRTSDRPTRQGNGREPAGWICLTAASFAVALLSGCAAPQDSAQQAAAPAADTAAQAESRSTAPPGNPYDRSGYHDSDIVNKESALWPEPPINDDPNQLLGLDKLRLDGLLGEPTLIRREAPAEIWQYETESCVLDVFLYDTVGVLRVTYVEARDKEAQFLNPRGCLNRLLKARMRASLG